MQWFLILFQPELRSGAVRQFLRQVSLSLFLRVCCGSSAADRTAIQKNHWSVQRVPIGSATDRSIDRWSGKMWTTPSRSVTTHIDSRPCSEKNREKIIPLFFFFRSIIAIFNIIINIIIMWINCLPQQENTSQYFLFFCHRKMNWQNFKEKRQIIFKSALISFVLIINAVQ